MRPHPAAMLRMQLDRKVMPYRSLRPFRPSRGWISAMRHATGVSREELADRMGVTSTTLGSLERREANEAIPLKALRQAAEALDCTLVYALVPRHSLEELARQRASEISEELLAAELGAGRYANPEEQEIARRRLIDGLMFGNPQRLRQPNDPGGSENS